jgi:hypothetical protein
MAIKIPLEILEAIELIQKTSNVDPREYPGISIKWIGCGDSGGIEDLNFLTPLGLEYVKRHHCAPATWQMRATREFKNQAAPTVLKDYYHATPIKNSHVASRETVTCGTNSDISALSQWVYEQWDLCETDDGSYGNIFIEVPFRKAWGESFDYVQEEVLNTGIDYVD